MIGYTPGGSPIFSPNISKRRHGPQGKTMHSCSSNEGHRLTAKQAKSSGYMCTHCGSELKVRQHKISEMRVLAEALGFEVTPKAKVNKCPKP